jgi:hypothetical protein
VLADHLGVGELLASGVRYGFYRGVLMANQLYYGNDASLTVTGFRNAVSLAYLNAATVTCQPYRIAATGVATAVGSPVTLTYTTSSNGDYVGTLESSVIDAGFAVDDEYRLDFVAVQSGVNAAWSLSGTVLRR